MVDSALRSAVDLERNARNGGRTHAVAIRAPESRPFSSTQLGASGMVALLQLW
jgi:hypothetical protein